MIRAIILVAALTGCTTEVVRYQQVSVPVPVLPEVPAHLLESYPGVLPSAAESGLICFGETDAKYLQEWMLWHKLKVDQLQEVLRDEQDN